jgi:hypothetical protein
MARPRGVWSDKQFRNALQLAVNEEDARGKKKLRAIAEKLVEQAMAGEGWAIEQVASRLDGKPAQEISVDASVSHELASLTDAELAIRIKRELTAIAGRGGEKARSEQLH